MSTLALTLPDFVAQLPFSGKIEAAQIDPFAQTAFALDLVPLLGHATLEAVDSLAEPGPITAYTDGMAFTADQLVSRRERVYRAVGSPLVTPPTDGKSSTDWAYEPLLTLWHHFLKPWWVQQAFSRFLPQHGKNITKAGVTQAIDRNQGTYDRPSASERAELQASVDVTAEALKSRLTRFLREEHLLHTSCGGGYNYYPDTCGIRTHAASSTRRHTRRVRGV